MVVYCAMSMESLNRTSDVIQTPSQIGETPIRVNVDVLKQRIIDQKKKDKFKRNIIVSSVCVSIGILRSVEISLILILGISIDLSL